MSSECDRLVRAILWRIPFERPKLWLWHYGERSGVPPLYLPTTWRGKLATAAGGRLHRLGFWLNRHHLTRRIRYLER